MNWTVEWEPDVWNELHQLWAISPDPASVRAASETAKQLLQVNPLGGLLLSEGLWRVMVPPLAVYYSVDLNRHYVRITDVLPTARHTHHDLPR